MILPFTRPQIHGEYIGFGFSESDYVFSGSFVGCDFRDTDLRGARLVGTFQFCDFRGAFLDGAQGPSLIVSGRGVDYANATAIL